MERIRKRGERIVERYEERMMMDMKGEGDGDADRLQEVWWKAVGQAVGEGIGTEGGEIEIITGRGGEDGEIGGEESEGTKGGEI